MDTSTLFEATLFRDTISAAIREKSAQLYGDSCTFDFFPTQIDATKRQSRRNSIPQNVYYASEGLTYLEKYLGHHLFNPKQNILVARYGQPFPVVDLTQLSEENKNEDDITDLSSPQKKFPKLNIDRNQNNLNDNRTESIYDTCGSPLKLQTYADLSMCDSPSYASPAIFKRPRGTRHIPVGLSARDSRQLLSQFCCNYTEVMEKSVAAFSHLPSFWCLCNISDTRSRVMIGVEPVMSKAGEVYWGLKETTVTQNVTDDLLTASSKIFKQNFHENKCFARYDLVESISSGSGTEGDPAAYQGSLSLEFQWKNGTKLLQKPEFHSEAVIKASVHSGDVRSPAIDLYEELTILKTLMAAITTSEIQWAASEGHAPLLDMVKELIENLKLGTTGSFKKLHGEDTEKAPSDEFKLQERLDYDFTDYLWKILITCSSYNDLTTCLNFIFKALGKGEFQPAVHKKNKTMMAQYIRDSYTGRLIIPHLGGMFPLKLVVEMGIEKLRCDYINAFVSHDLTTPNHLEYFLQVEVDLEEKIVRMEKMHYSLEMVVMIRLFLRLSYSVLGTCARKMLKDFETNDINFNEIFNFPVQTKAVLPVIKDSLPALWSLRVENKVGDLDLFEYKVWTLTTNQPFIHLIKTEEEKEEKVNQDKARFFLTHREDIISILGY